MKRAHVAALLLGSVALSGCATYSLEELRRTTPKGTPLQNALSQAYMEFADSEEKQYDWIDSMHFADKGLMSAYGKTVHPEDLKEWSIPAEALPELERARAQLIAALSSGAVNSQPETLARAQVNFDCWVEQQEEAWQEEDIAYCRDNFSDAMQSLGAPGLAEPSPSAASVPEPIPAPAPAPEPVKAAAEPEPDMMASEPAPETAPVPFKPLPRAADKESYVVFFEKGDTNLTVSGKKVIDEVSMRLETAYTTYEVVLNSYTDTVGDAKSNLKLTEQRAQMVKQRLVEGGVNEANIRIFAFGESDPPVKTADNVDEPANRRVEIFISE